MEKSSTREPDNSSSHLARQDALHAAMGTVLLKRDEWIVRCVTNLLPDSGGDGMIVERTFDIDVASVRRVYREVLGYQPIGPLWLPLWWTNKAPIRSLDAKDPRGTSLAVLTRGRACSVAGAAFLAYLEQNGRVLETDREGVRKAAVVLAETWIEDSQGKKKQEGDDEERRKDDRGDLRRAVRAVSSVLVAKTIDGNEGPQRAQYLTIGELTFLNLLMTRSLRAVQAFSTVDDEILIVRTREHVLSPRPPLGSLWRRTLTRITPGRPQGLTLDAESTISVSAPRDMRVMDLERWWSRDEGISPPLFELEEVLEYCGEGAYSGASPFQKSLGDPSRDESWVTSHVPDMRAGICKLRFQLVPKAGFFIWPATWLATAMVGIVLVVLTNITDTASGSLGTLAAPILLALPTLIIALLSYRDEWALVTHALHAVRTSLWIAAMTLMVVALLIAIQPSPTFLPIVLAAALSACWAGLALAWGTLFRIRLLSARAAIRLERAKEDRDHSEDAATREARGKRSGKDEKRSWRAPVRKRLRGVLLWGEGSGGGFLPTVAAYSWVEVTGFGALVALNLVGSGALWAVVSLFVVGAAAVFAFLVAVNA